MLSDCQYRKGTALHDRCGVRIQVIVEVFVGPVLSLNIVTCSPSSYQVVGVSLVVPWVLVSPVAFFQVHKQTKQHTKRHKQRNKQTHKQVTLMSMTIMYIHITKNDNQAKLSFF